MARKIVLGGELVEKMIDFFTSTCFLLERARNAQTDVELYECVQDADYATYRTFGYKIGDIFAKRS